MSIPFRPPPAPEPGLPGSSGANGTATSSADATAEVDHSFLPDHSRSKRKSFRTTIKRKSWSTTITVTETTDAHGRKSYKATNSPVVQIAEPIAPPYPESGAAIEEPLTSDGGSLDERAVRWRQPFLQRMWLRQQDSMARRRERDSVQMPGHEHGYGEMVLISVKRQRKYKIKKKKHKKLLKRTRNLRRKLGKA